jgi:hypothetical protein
MYKKEKNKARTNIYCTQGRVAYVNDKKKRSKALNSFKHRDYGIGYLSSCVGSLKRH